MRRKPNWTKRSGSTRRLSTSSSSSGALKEEAKKPAAVGIVLVASFMLTATHAQSFVETDEKYPLSREAAHESVAFMLNNLLHGGPGVSEELMQGIRATASEMFVLGWKMRAAAENCGRVFSDRRCAQMLSDHLRDAGY
ncbi:MAG: hypothetical protein OXP74_08040 [Acidobacteriota bacterium]|nr:hypothetical protein [Acidobacteriota bacterium]